MNRIQTFAAVSIAVGSACRNYFMKAELPRPCPYRKPHPAGEQTANRLMFVPDDRFSHVAGMRADQALPIEGTA
jgi:hypothetical protein